MAAEAIYEVKKAEEKGSEILRSANEKAREIIKKAEVDATRKQREILNEAIQQKQKLLNEAVQRAEEDCIPLTLQSEQEKAAILNPDKQKFEKAVQIVIERIVNDNGNR